MIKVEKIKLNTGNVGKMLLNSDEIDAVLLSCGYQIKSNFGKDAKVTLHKHYKGSNRHRVFVDAPYEEASKNNNLLKAVRKKK